MKRLLLRMNLLLALTLIATGCTTITPFPTTTTVRRVTTTLAIEDAVTTTTQTSNTIKTTSTTVTAPTFGEETFHTDITLTLDKTVYALNETMQVQLENKTGDSITFGRGFVVLKPTENGDYTMLYNTFGTQSIAFVLKNNGVLPLQVKLSQYELTANQQYKLVLKVGEKWVSADFRTGSGAESVTSTTTRQNTTATTTWQK